MAWFSDVDLDNPPPLGRFITNSLSIFYCTMSALWVFTMVVLSLWMYLNRNNGATKLRNVPITLLTVWTSTVIIIFNLMQYPLNGSLSCDLEFWIYSIVFPLSVVLLQAKNTQLYIIFAKNLDAYLSRRERSPKLLPHKVKKYMLKGGIDVMIFHLAATGFIYVFSSRFNTRGVLRGSTEGNPNLACHDGWEWYPKHLGLLIYTYIIGPVLIYSLQKIEDTHNIKHEILATILTSWACLPLFIFSYKHHSFSRINHAIPPLLWFNISLVAICVICFAFPAYEMYKTRRLRNKEILNTRNTFIRLLDAKISQDFAKVLSDPMEFQKFAAFTVKDLSVESPLFFERAMKWRKDACAIYDVNPSISERDCRKFNTSPSSGLRFDHFTATCTQNSTASTAFVDPRVQGQRARVYPNVEGDSENTLDKPRIDTSPSDDNRESTSSFVHGAAMRQFGSNGCKAFMMETLEQTLSKFDRFNDAEPPRAPLKIDKIRELEARSALMSECNALIQEFILADVPLAINIVSSTRKAILSAYETERGYQIVFIFDRAIAEVVELMYRNTYVRYIAAKRNSKNKYSLPLFNKR